MRIAEFAWPLGAACLLATAMLWLAGGPFDEPPPERGFVVRPLVLRAPVGTLRAFPGRFAWDEAPGATLYEITVVPDGSRTPLFRQHGRRPGVEITFEPGFEPPPGRYEWTVLALRGEHPVGLGAGEFTVRPDSAAPPPPAAP